ncbi:unnamed protein product [Periconia digitata]|uniref:Peptidase S54 rhomboid domain-containing protein n=1 Tax=Periconia digitata TaxID=1303443 RepID=A0A9W4XXA6_9PLEO|nr:unnamed protein product [Periconia digitata]
MGPAYCALDMTSILSRSRRAFVRPQSLYQGVRSTRVEVRWLEYRTFCNTSSRQAAESSPFVRYQQQHEPPTDYGHGNYQESQQSGWTGGGQYQPPGGIKIRIIRPALFTLGLSITFVAAFAFFKAKQELKPVRRTLSSFLPQIPSRRTTAPGPIELVEDSWKQLSPLSKLSYGIIGFNSSIHLASYLFPKTWMSLWHIPSLNRNSTLLTSAFVHSGLFHLGFNMWACSNFVPAVGYSPLFRGDQPSICAFILSTALLTGFSQHVASAVFQRGTMKTVPCGGLSGALFALFGAYCMERPTAHVGIVFIPLELEAQYFLPSIMLFDLVGMVRGFQFVNLGHAAHLSGALLGIAYSYFDGYRNVWRPAVDTWKRILLKQRKA